MQLKNLLDWSYWFYQPFSAYGWVLWFWVLAFLALVLAGLILRTWSNIHADNAVKTALRRFASLGMTMGFFGLVWLFFRQQRAILLGWRFWLVVWAVIFIWWLVKCLIYVVKRLPAIRAQQAKRELTEKYLPKK